MKPAPAVIATVLLGATWGLLGFASRSDPVLARKSLNGFPLVIENQWTGRELGLDPEILDVLKLSDYLMRVYVAPQTQDGIHNEHRAVWLYIGYYQSQRTGTTYHSPKNCLPGAGWQFMESDQVPVQVTSDTVIHINRVLIQKGLDKQVILYWYHDRGRIIASEYWAKAYLIWDAITKHRTDGALVRLSIPVTTGPDEAYETGLAFLKTVWPLLPSYMPST